MRVGVGPVRWVPRRVSGKEPGTGKGKTMAYTVTVRCQCGASYMTTKQGNAPTPGQVTIPNGGQKCPGCDKAAPAVVVAVQKG